MAPLEAFNAGDHGKRAVGSSANIGAQDLLTQVSRRAVFTALPIAAVALPMTTDAALASMTPARKITAGPLLDDIKAARRGLEDVRPLIELNEAKGYDAARIAFRKEPLNGIRKACTYLIMLLPKGSDELSEKTKLYETIKTGIQEFDDGCRPDTETRPDLQGMLSTLSANLEAFAVGFAADMANSASTSATVGQPAPTPGQEEKKEETEKKEAEKEETQRTEAVSSP
jgi:hypothetical protein